MSNNNNSFLLIFFRKLKKKIIGLYYSSFHWKILIHKNMIENLIDYWELCN